MKMSWIGRTRRLAPALVVALALLPSATFAQPAPPVVQPAQYAFCGVSLPFVTGNEVMLTQPADLGENDEGIINYSAVRGSIAHVDGPLVLLQLDRAGVGNAALHHDLAGDHWAVVHLPDECLASEFAMGSNMLALGTPTEQGILDAVEVAKAG